MTGQKFSRV